MFQTAIVGNSGKSGSPTMTLDGNVHVDGSVASASDQVPNVTRQIGHQHTSLWGARPAVRLRKRKNALKGAFS